MDLKTNVQRVENMIYSINGCDYDEAVAVIEVVRQRAITKMNARNKIGDGNIDKMKGGKDK